MRRRQRAGRALPRARAGRKAAGGAHGGALCARPAETRRERRQGGRANSRGCRTRTCAAGWRRCTAPAAAAAASRSSCRAGAASTRWLGRAGPGGQQSGAGRARAQGAQAAAQGAERRRFGAAGGLHASDEADPWLEARDAAIVELLYGCGLRVGELVGLDAQGERRCPRLDRSAGRRGPRAGQGRQAPHGAGRAQGAGGAASWLALREHGAQSRAGRRFSSAATARA